jgi:hypothetical protein
MTDDIQTWRDRADVSDYAQFGLPIRRTLGDLGVVSGPTGTSARLQPDILFLGRKTLHPRN